MTDLHFAAPGWANAFYALAAFIVALVWLERRRSGSLDRFVSAALRERLVRETTPWRRQLRLGLLGLSVVFLVFALMRKSPQHCRGRVSTDWATRAASFDSL